MPITFIDTLLEFFSRARPHFVSQTLPHRYPLRMQYETSARIFSNAIIMVFHPQIMVRITDSGERILDEAPPLMQETFVERFSNLQEWEQSMILSALQRMVSLMDAKAIEAAPFLAASTMNMNAE
jgi:hypothetical protein